MSLLARSLEVVGAQHPNADGSDRRFFIKLCLPGEPVELRPEPKNPHDEQAIAVFSERGGQLGYLSADRAPRIGQLMKQGVEVRAIFQAPGGRGAWIRVAFAGEEPVLPKVREPVAPEEAEFWPDPEWEED